MRHTMATEELKTYEEYEKLLKEFKKVPIQERKRTFMGICQYPGNRYEEICSRILAYYFNPNEDHGFKDMWFRAFWQCLNVDSSKEYNMPTKISLEVPTSSADEYQNKRIDLIIETENTVYAIENKIGASLYNNLCVYAEHINRDYPQKTKVMVVLTAHLLNVDEIKKAQDSGFKEVSYQKLFENVKAMLGDYVTSMNNNQLTFMLDFMNTLNNKMNVMGNKQLNEFFTNNGETVKKLIDEYNQWKVEMYQIKVEKLRDICGKIRETTNDKRWKASDWEILLEFANRIGISSTFEGDKLKIRIRTWGQKPKESWHPYKKAISDAYPDIKAEQIPNENNFQLIIKSDVEEKDIIENLTDCYTILKNIVEKK